MKRSIVVPTALAACVPFSLSAQSPDTETVIVTATRTAQTVDEALATVTVITRGDIERAQARTLEELLAGVAGIDLAINGGYGKFTSLFLRGTNSDHVLVLIDGVRVGSATTGTVSWQFLPPAQIERIEIVRGPRSSLYGSEAIGGVIQIFTRRGAPGLQARAQAGYGSYDTREIAAGLSGAREDFHYNIQASHFRTDGIDARRPVGGVDEPDRDGYRNSSVTLRLGQRLASGAQVEASLLHAQGETEFDRTTNSTAFAQNQTEFLQQAAGVRLTAAPAGGWRTRLELGTSKDHADQFFEGEFRSTFNTDRRTASWHNDVALAVHQLLSLGVDYYDDRVSGTTTYTVSERDNTGVYVQHQATFGGHDLLLSLRHDDNQQFGGHNTGNVAWGYAFGARRAVLSYGTAFKAPSFNQLFFPGFGNPSLRPEESQTVEAALRGREDWGRWDVRAYRTDIDNLIATVCDAFFHCTAENVNRARIRGLEAELGARVTGWDTALQLALLDPRDVATDKILPRRSRRTLKLDADRAFGKWRLGGSLIAQDHRYDNAANTIRVAGYGIVHLRAHYAFARHWELRARLENVLDKEYQTVHTYNSPGRNVFVSVAYRSH